MKTLVGIWSVVSAVVAFAVGCCDGAEERPDPDMGTWETGTGYATAGDSSVDSLDPRWPEIGGSAVPPLCSVNSDCTSTFPPCYVNACLDGICGSEILPDGSPCKPANGSSAAAVCIHAICVPY